MSVLTPYLRPLRALVWPYRLHDRLLRRALRQFEGAVCGRLVDLGCGDFRLSRAFFPRAEQVFGIDRWLAARCHRAAPPGARFVYASLEAAPFRDASFDTAVCTEVLEHVRDEAAAWREIARLVKPGGRLILSLPFALFVHGGPNDFRRYTIHGLAERLEAHGFALERYIAVGEGAAGILARTLAHLGFRPWARRALGRAALAPVLAAGNLAGQILAALTRCRCEGPEALSGHDRRFPLGYAVLARRLEGAAAGRSG